MRLYVSLFSCAAADDIGASMDCFRSFRSASLSSRMYEAGRFRCLVRLRVPLLFFVRRVGNLRRGGADDAIVHAASLCVGFLQMMGTRASGIRAKVAEQLEALINQEDGGALLEAAGFILPNNDGAHTHISGGMRMMLDRFSNLLGYGPPVSTIETRGDHHKCYLKFPAAEDSGVVELRTFGRVSSSVAAAIGTALYNSLLAFSVNQGVEIRDPNRNAYVFAKERVREVALDMEHLGNSGSAICSYFDSTRRGLNLTISSFSEILRRHPVGKELAGKLHAVAAEVDQCLTSITGPVRTLNENLVVGALPF